MSNNQKNCLNCNQEILNQSKFCSNCGQSTNQHRINLAYIWHELIHAFTHADKGIFFTILENFKRPGIVAKEYVEGKRKKYFSPFTFLLIVLGITSLFFSKYQLMRNCNPNSNPISDFIDAHYNFFLFSNIPIITLLNWIFFRKSKHNYTENLVLVAYTSAIRCVFLNVIVIPLILLVKYLSSDNCGDANLIFYAYTIISMVYFAWATTVFNQEKTIWGFIKGILVNLIITFLIGFIIGFYYYLSYQNK